MWDSYDVLARLLSYAITKAHAYPVLALAKGAGDVWIEHGPLLASKIACVPLAITL